MLTKPSPRVAAALADAQMRAELAAESGDTDGARYARAEVRAILRRLTRGTHR